jgi:3-hydroxybutyryl-CoA dehydrogenase
LSDQAIDTVLVIGSGWVGRQIAMQTASHGCRTYLFDRLSTATEQALRWSLEQTERLVARGVWNEAHQANINRLLSPALQLDEPSIQPDLVIECVPEQASLKKRLLKELSETFGPAVILASNSSYFTPSMFQASLTHPERFVHYHFHVPVFLSTAVDIMPWEGTSPRVVERLLELSKRIGQKPLLCRKEHPGYVFNWLLQALIRSALELVDQGVATPEEIDQRWMDLSGMKKGPFWIMDQIGLDIVQQALQNSRFTQPAPAETLIRFLEKWIAAGHLGQKTGAGFYSYPTQLLDWETTLHGK